MPEQVTYSPPPCLPPAYSPYEERSALASSRSSISSDHSYLHPTFMEMGHFPPPSGQGGAYIDSQSSSSQEVNTGNRSPNRTRRRMPALTSDFRACDVLMCTLAVGVFAASLYGAIKSGNNLRVRGAEISEINKLLASPSNHLNATEWLSKSLYRDQLKKANGPDAAGLVAGGSVAFAIVYVYLKSKFCS